MKLNKDKKLKKVQKPKTQTNLNFTGLSDLERIQQKRGEIQV